MRAISTVLAMFEGFRRLATPLQPLSMMRTRREGYNGPIGGAKPKQPARGEGEAAWLQPTNYLRRS